MSPFLFLLMSGVGCDFCLWLFLDLSVYLLKFLNEKSWHRYCAFINNRPVTCVNHFGRIVKITLNSSFAESRSQIFVSDTLLNPYSMFLKSGPGDAKIFLVPYANNKGAYQPAHPCSLISTFVVRCLDSMICILALSKI